jgi:hypothetical protein
MVLRISLGALLLAAPTVASAQTMNAEEFHKSAAALLGKGAMAVFSMGQVKALTAEAKAAGEKARQTRLAAIAVGKAPRYCPPDGPQAMGSSEFMGRLSAIPASERIKIDMTEAMTRILEVKFPCKS